MKLSKLVRFVSLALIVAATALPASAARPCSCTYCPTVSADTPCSSPGSGVTTCGSWLAVTLCPAG